MADWCNFDRFCVLIPKTILGSLMVNVMISCRCVILTNYWQFTLVRLSQKAVSADALFFLMRADMSLQVSLWWLSVCPSACGNPASITEWHISIQAYYMYYVFHFGGVWTCKASWYTPVPIAVSGIAYEAALLVICECSWLGIACLQSVVLVFRSGLWWVKRGTILHTAWSRGVRRQNPRDHGKTVLNQWLAYLHRTELYVI